MTLLNRLISDIEEAEVEEVIVGVHSVLVKTNDACGIASTIKYCGHNINVENAGNLEDLNLKNWRLMLCQIICLKHLLEWLRSIAVSENRLENIES